MVSTCLRHGGVFMAASKQHKKKGWMDEKETERISLSEEAQAEKH